MMTTFQHALTSRLAGPIATAVAAVLAAVLVISWRAWETERIALEAQVADLTEQAERSQALWRTQLAACQAVAPNRLTQAQDAGDTAEQRLLTQGPAGMDGCARMESADQAVLSTLTK